MIQKVCGNCGKPYLGQSCSSCKSKRNSSYNQFDRDLEQNAVYQHPAWGKAREHILSRDGGICRMCYSLYGRIVIGRIVHHIIPVEEDKDLWYDPDNLVFVCHKHHEEIHSAYHKSKTEKARMQSRLRTMFEWE